MQKATSIFSGAAVTLLLAATTVSAQSPQTTKFEIISPLEGQVVNGDKIPVLFNVEGVKLTDFQTNKTAVSGQGHIHVWLDDEKPTAESATKLTTEDFIFSDVPYGEHTLKAELVNNNHTSLTPAKVINIKFKSEPAATPSPVTGSSFDKNTALVILVIVALVIVSAWWYTREEDEEMEQMETTNKKQKTKTTKKKPVKKAAVKSRRK